MGRTDDKRRGRGAGCEPIAPLRPAAIADLRRACLELARGGAPAAGWTADDGGAGGARPAGGDSERPTGLGAVTERPVAGYGGTGTDPLAATEPRTIRVEEPRRPGGRLGRLLGRTDRHPRPGDLVEAEVVATHRLHASLRIRGGRAEALLDRPGRLLPGQRVRARVAAVGPGGSLLLDLVSTGGEPGDGAARRSRDDGRLPFETPAAFLRHLHALARRDPESPRLRPLVLGESFLRSATASGVPPHLVLGACMDALSERHGAAPGIQGRTVAGPGTPQIVRADGARGWSLPVAGTGAVLEFWTLGAEPARVTELDRVAVRAG